MNRSTLIEVLVWASIGAIVIMTIVGVRNGTWTIAPDGKAIYTVVIDGHQYLKSGENLTHSASCPCGQKEKP